MPSKRKVTNLKTGEAVQIEVTWSKDDTLETLYVNQLAILNTGSEFYLTFGELIPPNVAILGDKIPPQIEIKSKVRLAMHTQSLERIIELLQKTLDGKLPKVADGS